MKEAVRAKKKFFNTCPPHLNFSPHPPLTPWIRMAEKHLEISQRLVHWDRRKSQEIPVKEAVRGEKKNL